MSKAGNKDATKHNKETLKRKGFLKSFRTDKNYRRKCVLTLCCSWAYGMYGWQAAQIGTALSELQQILNVDLDTISWIYTCFYIGTIFGGLLFGFLYDRFNRLTVITICIIGVGILHGLIPLSTSFPATLVLRFFIGVFDGGIESGMVTIVTTIWGTEEASFIYVSYLSFCIGGFLGPLVTTPLMSNDFQVARNTVEEQLNETIWTQNRLNNTSSIIKHLPVTTLSPLNITDGDSRIFLAFVMTGVVTIIASVPFIYMIKTNTYYNIRLILDSFRNEQHSNEINNQTDFDKQTVSDLKCESTKAPDVNARKQTKVKILEINDVNLLKITKKADNDFDIIENLPNTRNIVTDNFDLTCVNVDNALNNRHEQINKAFVGEQQNEFKEHYDTHITNSVHTAITDNDLTYLPSTLNQRTNTEYDPSDSKILKLQTNLENAITRISKQNQESSKSNNLKSSTSKAVILHGKYKICIIIFIDMLSVFMYAGDDAIFNFLPTFCLEYLNWTLFSSSSLLSAFSIASVFGGFIGLFLSKVISPTKLMLTALIGWNLSTLCGFFASASRVDWLIWMSVSISGVFIIMVPPTAATWIQQNVCPITGKISASLTLASGIGMASTPNIIGYTMQTITHMYYWYTLTGFAVVGCIAFGVAVVIQRCGISTKT